MACTAKRRERADIRPFRIQLCALCLLLSLADISPVRAQALSLSDALSTALRRNTIIRSSLLDEKISGYALSIKKSIYIPSVQAEFSSAINKTSVQTIEDYLRRVNNHYQISLSKKNSIGGTSSVNFSTRKDDISYMSSGFVAREYTSEAFFRYEQPLLRGFGRNITNLEVDKALLNKGLARKVAEDVTSQVLFTVYKDYFSL